MKPLLKSFLQQIQGFRLNKEDMTRFVGETKIKLSDLHELPIEPDDLMKQTNLLRGNAVSTADRDEMMAKIYAYFMTSAYEKNVLLAKAIPPPEGIHDGFDNVMQVIEDMDRELQMRNEKDLDTQAELIFLLEEDILQKIRPEDDDLTLLSTQLQALCSDDRADELFANTVAI
ncbi:hypothetical protein CRE_05164 [Caenorhabditis remanei]|uniref:Uncharacterized protein n=1 Tax=Caenorhabditis remanei TaxID=31234 RepID=E3N6E3_CAERE|nr:hypothetical protein CRE_05164 [Caenorhabditis remanei]